MSSRITTETFLEAFVEAETAHRDALQAVYKTRPARTRLMLDRGGVLNDVCRRLESRLGLGLEYKKEWYTIDALFVSGEELRYEAGSTDRHGHRLWYPSRLDVLIEHENDEMIEEEMWKLLFWHADLKVLIAYDYCDDEHAERARIGKHQFAKGEWAPSKLDKLRQMYREVYGHRKNTDAEYLLLLGNRESWTGDSGVKWRWCRIDDERHSLCPLSVAV